RRQVTNKLFEVFALDHWRHGFEKRTVPNSRLALLTGVEVEVDVFAVRIAQRIEQLGPVMETVAFGVVASDTDQLQLHVAETEVLLDSGDSHDVIERVEHLQVVI